MSEARLLLSITSKKQNDMKSIWPILKGDSPEEALHIATINERIDDMRRLIADGVDVNAKRATIMSAQNLDTPLHIAATYGLINSAELLIASNASLNILDGMALTPLMCACSCGGVAGSRIAVMLIEAGADVTVIRQSDGMTALKFAAKECDPQVIQALLEHGAEVDGPLNTDQTALMLASRGNNVAAIEVLIHYGADLKRACGLSWAKGKTAVWLAENEGCIEAYEYLRQF